MEINKLDDAIGAVATMDLVEGRLVILVPATDVQGLPIAGARYPENDTEAAVARYVVTWPQSNLPFPGPLSYPSLAYALRQGFDQPANAPFSQTVYTTYPGMTDGATIPSGYDVVLHGGDDGVYTISSGVFVHSASLVTGSALETLNTGDDTTQAGMLASWAGADAQTTAYVVSYNAPYRRLTIKTRAL